MISDEPTSRLGGTPRVTPTGEMTRFPLPHPEAYPLQIVTGPDGHLWFTDRGSDRIGRLTTVGGVLTEFPLPVARAFDGATGQPIPMRLPVLRGVFVAGSNCR